VSPHDGNSEATSPERFLLTAILRRGTPYSRHRAVGYTGPHGRPLPAGLAGTRDHALLLLAANGLSRAALVGLDLEHIRFTTTGVELLLGAKADRSGRRTAGEGRGAPVVVRPSADRDLCLVQALRGEPRAVGWLPALVDRYPSSASTCVGRRFDLGPNGRRP
jgi:hypothetical protein